ncbi:thiamine pyrophosphate-binding protein, partial [Aspergillus homomorphus CBS 101889]
VVGISGGAALPVFDALHDGPPFKFILAHHEQGAGHMAEGYARASGKPGVVLVTSGPGTSNLATPLLDALRDGVPLVAVCGDVATAVQGSGAFQEIDTLALARPCTKWCGMPAHVDDLPACIARAFHEATTGRPGPTLLAIPRDVAKARFTPGAAGLVGDQPAIADSADNLGETLDAVTRLLRVAKQPVLIAGHGLLNAAHGPVLLRRLTETVPIPTATTLLGMGAVDELHPLALGMLGTYGTVPANLAVQNADLILALGARLDERAVGDAAGFGPAARQAAREGRGGIVHFDIHAPHIGKVVAPTVAVEGDLAVTLALLLRRVEENTPEGCGEWLRRVQAWKETYPLAYQPPAEEKRPSLLLPQEVVAELDAQTSGRKDSTIVTTGVGQHQMWMARYYRWRRPGTLVSSGGLGTMGFGLPAAIGVKLARPECAVVDIDGDASLCMTVEEMLTAVQHGVAVKVLVLRNEEQGMIQELQEAEFDGRVTQARQRNPNFAQLAQSMGARARRCDTRGELGECIAWLLGMEGVALLEVLVQGGVPMVPKVAGGKALDAILEGL